MSVKPRAYALDIEYPLKWVAQSSSSRDLPFFGDISQETPDQYITRTYLQFLWLPESIMSLQLLIPSLLRIMPQSPEPHPLHALVDPLLLTPRACTNKYHTEVPQILADEGGAGDIEEGTMWFAVGYEKGHEHPEQPTGDSDTGEIWKTKWLQRMERREVQIQILLHFLILSLPGPFPKHASSPSKKRKRSQPSVSPQEINPSAALEDRLESFMDKLSTWQLLSSLDQDPKEKGREKDPNVLDWMQIFCRDIVEPQFKSCLPDLTTLLRAKLFPHSPFSSSSRSSSPSSRSSSPFPNLDKKQAKNSGQGKEGSRARSLSMSLAEDRTQTVPGKKKLSREFSMTRVFKSKPEAKVNELKARSKIKVKEGKVGYGKPNKRVDAGTGDIGVTLVAATPVKNRANYVRAEPTSPTGASRRAQNLGIVKEEEAEEDQDELLLGADWEENGEDGRLVRRVR